MIYLLFLALWSLLAAVPPPDPPLADLTRFPPRSVTYPLVRLSEGGRPAGFLHGHLAWLREQVAFYPAGTLEWRYYRGWLDEAWVRYDTWNTLDDALTVEKGESTRRCYLARLRQLLGEEAYFAGRMPPPVAIEFFRRED